MQFDELHEGWRKIKHFLQITGHSWLPEGASNWGNYFGKLAISSTLSENVLNLWDTFCLLFILSCCTTRVFMSTCCVVLINILIHVFLCWIYLCFSCNDITTALNLSHLLGLVAHNEFTKYPSKLTNLQFLVYQCLASAVHTNRVTTCYNRCPIFQHTAPCPVGSCIVSAYLAGRVVKSRHFLVLP